MQVLYLGFIGLMVETIVVGKRLRFFMRCR